MLGVGVGEGYCLYGGRRENNHTRVLASVISRCSVGLPNIIVAINMHEFGGSVNILSKPVSYLLCE